eukprot:gb/GEZN01003471.1/.p1 GENE.gb/GEZN01003471.1/~~gb/GEZN01003471.1/.p1  ORF type:complete len:680 (+),score=78.72 gb/GEZN01003471.1/:209-2041(+)
MVWKQREFYPVRGREPAILLTVAVILSFTPMSQFLVSVLGLSDHTLPCVVEAIAYCFEPLVAYSYIIRTLRLLFQYNLSALQASHLGNLPNNNERSSLSKSGKRAINNRPRVDMNSFWVKRYYLVRTRNIILQVVALALIQFAIFSSVIMAPHRKGDVACNGIALSPARLAGFAQTYFMAFGAIPLGRMLKKFDQDNLGIRREISIVAFVFCLTTGTYLIALFVYPYDLQTRSRFGGHLIMIFFWFLLSATFLYPVWASVHVAARLDVKSQLSTREGFKEFLCEPSGIGAHYLLKFLTKEFAQESLLFTLDVFHFQEMMASVLGRKVAGPSTPSSPAHTNGTLASRTENATSPNTLSLGDPRPSSGGHQRRPSTSSGGANHKLDVLEFAQFMSQMYLNQDSFNCINISHRLRNTIENNLNKLGIKEGVTLTGEECSTADEMELLEKVWDDALKETMNMMEAILSRFMASDEFEAAETTLKQGGKSLRGQNNPQIGSNVLDSKTVSVLSTSRALQHNAEQEEHTAIDLDTTSEEANLLAPPGDHDDHAPSSPSPSPFMSPSPSPNEPPISFSLPASSRAVSSSQISSLAPTKSPRDSVVSTDGTEIASYDL